ncbi:Hypothetical protein A7982_06766 [Minicystis rosea]|nr:Hypothetical protein A7982_06766 [Minicystis rosea]
MTLYTVGHGSRSLDELVDVLRAAEIGRLVDVRRYPGSRRHPHFARAELSESIPRAGILYDFRGDVLGGRRSPVPRTRHPAWRDPSFRAYADYMDTPSFRDALRRLEDDAAAGPPLAFMCAETLWWQCHRRLIADALAVRGHQVVHLLRVGERQPHALHPDLRVDEEGRPVYDLHVTGELIG